MARWKAWLCRLGRPGSDDAGDALGRAVAGLLDAGDDAVVYPDHDVAPPAVGRQRQFEVQFTRHAAACTVSDRHTHACSRGVFGMKTVCRIAALAAFLVAVPPPRRSSSRPARRSTPSRRAATSNAACISACRASPSPTTRASGRGLDVDYCKSLAAAVLGDATKVKFTPTSVQQRWAGAAVGPGRPAVAQHHHHLLAQRHARRELPGHQLLRGPDLRGAHQGQGRGGQGPGRRHDLRRRRLDRGEDRGRLVPRAQPQGHHHQLPEERRRHLGLRPGPLRRLHRGHRRAGRPAHQVQGPGRAPDPDRDHLQRSAGPGDALGRRALAARSCAGC